MKTVAEEEATASKKPTRVFREERKLVEERDHYQKLNSELEAKKKEIIDRAKTEASTLLKETNREIEKTIRHIRENKQRKKKRVKCDKDWRSWRIKFTANCKS